MAAGFSVGSADAAPSVADRLLADLQAIPAFRAKIPTNRSVVGLDHIGPVRVVAFTYERTPDEVPRVPLAIDTYTAANCDPTASLLAIGEVSGQRTESASLTTTSGWEIGASVSFEVGFPVVGKTNWTFTGKYSRSTAETTQTSRSTTVKQGFRSPVLPMTAHDLQLIVYEEKVEGVPYRLDMALEGRARVRHRLTDYWLPKSAGRSRAFIGGEEPVGDGTRELPVCRAEYKGATHPGKLVAGNCNITWDGKEILRSSYELLLGDTNAFKWSARTYRNGETDADKGVVAGTEEARACNADSPGYEDCVEDYPQQGRLYICAAKYRDGWHPGKLVIRDCMIGYAGKEHQIGEYKILTFEDVERSFDIELADYLTPEQLTVTVEGEMAGVAASSGELLRGPPRDLTPADCGIIETASADRTDTGTYAMSGAWTATGSPAPAVIEDRTVLASEIGGDGAAPEWHLRQIAPADPAPFGDDVVLVQTALNERGWPVKVDGFYGPRTIAAVQAFQAAHNLAPDGVVGGETLFWLGLSADTNPPEM